MQKPVIQKFYSDPEVDFFALRWLNGMIRPWTLEILIKATFRYWGPGLSKEGLYIATITMNAFEE
jgi:hypothetical protein